MKTSDFYVRDLLWVINSPPLMRFAEEESASRSMALQAREIDGEHLKQWIESDPERRVGRYFERLVLYWVRYVRGCEVIAQAQQVIEGDRTVGEIDLVFRDEGGLVNHWEIAVKFYLHLAGENTAEASFVGPNALDTLRKKRTRLIEHQLRLSVDRFPEVEVRHAFVRGRIFYYWKLLDQVVTSGELAPGHLTGRWLRSSEVIHAINDDQAKYRILEKPYWLAGQLMEQADSHDLDASGCQHKLEQHFSEKRQPVLLATFKREGSEGAESGRLFVVSDDWPAAHP